MTPSAYDPRPPYLQIADSVTDDIQEGRLRPGQRLPTIRAMAEHYGVASMTIQNALRHLREQGTIETARHRGSFVSNDQPYATGARDPHWVDTSETIVVVMTPMEAVAYQRFLRSQDLCLERIPGASIDAGPMFGVGTRG